MANPIKTSIDRTKQNLLNKQKEGKLKAKVAAQEDARAQLQAEQERKNKAEQDFLCDKLENSFKSTLSEASREYERREFEAMATGILYEFIRAGGQGTVGDNCVIFIDELNVLSGKFVHSFYNYREKKSQMDTYYFSSEVRRGDLELTLYRDDGQIVVTDGNHYPEERDAERYSTAHVLVSARGDVKGVRLGASVDSLDYDYREGGFYKPKTYTRELQPIIDRVDELIREKSQGSSGRGSNGNGEAQPE